MHVSPLYGTRIESTLSSAVPDRVMGHGGKFGTDAVAWAFQATVDPVRVPFAVPSTRRFPIHVALNLPLAVLPDCSVTFQRKSLQLLGEGAAFDDDHVPRRAERPLPDGPSVLVRSNPQLVTAAAEIDNTRHARLFLIRAGTTTNIPVRRRHIAQDCADSAPVSFQFRAQPVKFEIIAQRSGGAAKGQAVPRDLIRSKQSHFEALIVRAQRAAEDARRVHDDDR